MTPTQYVLARIGKFFGIDLRTKRLSDAGSELHLLREAETFLGHELWEKTSEIESLTHEYWKLRQLAEKQAELQARLDEREEVVRKASDELTIAPLIPDDLQLHAQRRGVLQREVQKLVQQRDAIIDQARTVRRDCEGLQAKLDVISKAPEQYGEDIQRTREKLEASFARFATLKEQRVAVGHAIERLDLQLTHVDNDIAAAQRAHDADTVASFQAMGGVNREISALRADLGSISTQMQALYAHVGRVVSRHVDRRAPDHKAFRKAIRGHRALIEVMRALRQSIAYNHILAGR